MTVTLGIDIGSISTKAVALIDGRVVFDSVRLTGYNTKNASRSILKDLEDAGLDPSSIENVVATGYGRNSVAFADKTITEITCHAAGVHFLAPDVRAVIDIGGQDSKAITVDETGHVRDFVMNDKCAAGTGRFLEVMARALEVDLDDFGAYSLASNKPSSVNSTCTVFAESEVISLIAKGEHRADIIAGIHDSVSIRVAAMAKRLSFEGPLMMTGGVAKNIGIVKALEGKFRKEIAVSEHAQLTGALGAALLAAA